MISLDTNLLVRYLVNDSPKQYQQVIELLNLLDREDEQAFVPLLVLIELNWVLSFSYDLARYQVIEGIEALMSLPMLSIESAEEVRKMLMYAKNNTFDLSDLLIGCRCAVADNLPVVTFDKKASKIDNFIAMKDFI